MPCCYDGLTARLIEQHGFEVTFMTGFGVSAVHGLPDAGLISYGEMVASAQRIVASLETIPCIGDGDTEHECAPHGWREQDGEAALHNSPTRQATAHTCQPTSEQHMHDSCVLARP